MTFARVVGNVVHDPVPASSQEDVKRFFHPDYISSKGGISVWVNVPDGTKHCAVYSGGNYENPPPKVYDRALTRPELRDFLVVIFGGGSTGKTKLGVVTDGFKTSTDGLVVYAREAFYDQQAYTKSEISDLIQLLRNKNIGGAGYITSAEVTAVSATWPTVTAP